MKRTLAILSALFCLLLAGLSINAGSVLLGMLWAAIGGFEVFKIRQGKPRASNHSALWCAVWGGLAFWNASTIGGSLAKGNRAEAMVSGALVLASVVWFLIELDLGKEA